MMKRTMEEVREQFEKYKKMFEEGYLIRDIAAAFNTNQSNVLNTFTLMGYSTKKEELENLVYADNSVNLEKVVINGNWMHKDGKKYRVNRLCTDITPIFSPR